MWSLSSVIIKSTKWKPPMWFKFGHVIFSAFKMASKFRGLTLFSDAGRWKTLGVPVVIGGDNLPSPVGIGLSDLPNIGGASGPPGTPGSGITVHRRWSILSVSTNLRLHVGWKVYLGLSVKTCHRGAKVVTVMRKTTKKIKFQILYIRPSSQC